MRIALPQKIFAGEVYFGLIIDLFEVYRYINNKIDLLKGRRRHAGPSLFNRDDRSDVCWLIPILTSSSSIDERKDCTTPRE
jgi:hypothetical protein